MKETYTLCHNLHEKPDSVMVCTYETDIVIAVKCGYSDNEQVTWLTIEQAHSVIENLYKAIIDIQLKKAGLPTEQP